MVLTAPGAAAIAVVRVVGPGVGAFLRKHFSRRAREGRCVHGELSDGAGRVIDDPVVVLHAGGADLSVHGGPWVVRSVLELLAREGFEVVEGGVGEVPGEAVDVRTAIEREVEAWLPLARTELAVRVLLAQVKAWEGLEGLEGRVDSEVARGMVEDLSLWRLLHPPRVAIVGAANVGKSTLANQLFAQERSIVADLPGTTRDWVGEMADVNGLAVMLVDTPGVRETGDAIERVAIERSREQVGRADLVVVVLDATRPLAGEQAGMLARHPGAMVVVNKVDQVLGEGMAAIGGQRTVASTGQGVEAVRAKISRYFGCEGIDPARARWWTERQRAWLMECVRDG